jgi:TRAP-type mannitol/chloroaromatic compound transport system substrate-binding protein
MRQVIHSAVALAAAAVFSAGAQAQQVSLKMQATWPASLTLYENFTYFAERVGKISGGSLKIEAMPAGQVVPAFEVLDATHKKVLDGAHAWSGYWVGKNKAAILCTGGPGGTFGMDMIDALGWMYHGGGNELCNEFFQKELKLNIHWIPILPSGPQAFGWFKRPIKNLADFKGMKCRETGMAAEVFQRMGMQTVNMPGGEIIPSAQRGVIDCAEWVGGVEDLRLGFQNVWKYHYTPGMHENVTIGELLINGDIWAGLSQTHKDIIQSAANETFLIWWAKWQKQNADALKELQEKHGVRILRTPPDILVEKARRARSSRRHWSRSAPMPRSWSRPSASTSRRIPSPRTTISRRRQRRLRRRNSARERDTGADIRPRFSFMGRARLTVR